jgi:hypothetical protein
MSGPVATSLHEPSSDICRISPTHIDGRTVARVVGCLRALRDCSISEKFCGKLIGHEAIPRCRVFSAGLSVGCRYMPRETVACCARGLAGGATRTESGGDPSLDLDHVGYVVSVQTVGS